MRLSRSSAYSQATLKWLRQEAMKIPGAKGVAHLMPRAYCIAKPAPLCAVFATPWMDAEPQVRSPEYSGYETVHSDSAEFVKVGEWYALAYVVTPGCQARHAFKIPIEPSGIRSSVSNQPKQERKHAKETEKA